MLSRLSGFTAVVTDPPYGLQFMGRQWDNQVPGADVPPAGVYPCTLSAGPR